MSYFTPSGSGGAITPVVVTGATNPTVTNISVPLANTEVSHALPVGTRKFYIKLRSFASYTKLAYAAGTSGTTYVTIHPGNWYGEEDLSLSGVTLYFQTTLAGQVAEIVSWT